MPTYHYQALNSEGRNVKGFIEAENQAKAFSLLQEQTLAPVSLHPVTRAGSRFAFLGQVRDLLPGPSIRLGESFYYLGLLLQSGSSLAEALDLMGRMAGRKGGQVWMNIRDKVETGESFSAALKKYPRHFPKVYVGMVQVAESVGKLGQVLERIAQYEEQRSEVSGRLTTAMVYPAVILMVGLGAVYFLLSKVLPNIAKIFQGSGQDLPWTTDFLLGLGKTLDSLGPAAALSPVIAVLCVMWAYQRTSGFRSRVDRWLWRIPLVQKNTLARFSGMLGFQLEAGIPLVQALQSSAQAIGSTYFQSVVKSAQAEVSAGQPLDKVLERTGAFPDIYILTLSTGQKAGKLGLFLQRMTRIMEKEVDNILKRVVALIEPLLILGIGLIVAFIVLAIMGPIFELTTLVR